MLTPMMTLAAAAAAFLALHLLVSGTRLRDALVAILGERAYLALFSLLSIGGIVWLAVSYNRALRGDNPRLWDVPFWLYHALPLFMLVAVLLVVIGMTTMSPTMALGEGLAGRKGAARGILTVTRHPFLWGAFIWATAHLAINADLASTLFFGCFVILTFCGTFSIDAKRARKLGQDWALFAGVTSNIPFAALLTGRTGLDLAGIGLWRVALALLVFAGLLFFHTCLFQVTPFLGVLTSTCPSGVY